MLLPWRIQGSNSCFNADASIIFPFSMPNSVLFSRTAPSSDPCGTGWHHSSSHSSSLLLPTVNIDSLKFLSWWGECTTRQQSSFIKHEEGNDVRPYKSLLSSGRSGREEERFLGSSRLLDPFVLANNAKVWVGGSDGPKGIDTCAIYVFIILYEGFSTRSIFYTPQFIRQTDNS